MIDRIVNKTTYLFGAIAFILSWVVNHSLLWGFLHLLLGEFYIIYWLIKYTNIEALIKSGLMV